jgi:tetratricopeptide (TPR) repeat protein
LKNCFVISPIGDSGSDIRKGADDLFELIITPALKPYDFKIIRADKVIGANIITNDIIHLVQNSELCIIDLTGSNPNVFYECGRRHETGKPFIQLIRSGEKLPFDVSGIRTIEYDLSSVRSAQQTIADIQLFVEDLIKTGFTSTSSGFSLSNISSTLERIEKKIENIQTSTTGWGSTMSNKSFSGSTIDDPMMKLKISADPFAGLEKATETGDLKMAETALQILYESNRNPHDYIKWCVIFAGLGDRIAFDILKKLLADETFDYTNMTEFNIYIVHFYTAFSKFREYETGYNLMIPKLIKFLDEEPDIESKTRFTCFEVIALFNSGMENYKDAIKYAEKALVINPNDVKVLEDLIYYYERLEKYEEANEVAKKVIDLTQYDIKSFSTFERIITNFYKGGQEAEAEKALAIYKDKFPTMYTSFIDLLETSKIRSNGKGKLTGQKTK